ncbi:hypothetical protein HDR59_04820 [bacterium]|nr:hypothetical protein [bacterium]
MLTKKLKTLTSDEVKEINSTLDIIDISLYDLIKKRTELIGELNQKTNLSTYDLSKSLSLTTEKITNERKYDELTLSTTIGLIKLINMQSKNIEIGISLKGNKSDELNGIISHIQNIFPLFNTKYKLFPTYTDIIKNITKNNNLMASIPATKTSPKDVWWMNILAPEKQNIKVINKIPLIESNDTTPEYLITYTDNFWNFDRSLIVIATSETTTKTWLKSALHRLEIPLYEVIDSTAIFNGTVLHLAEISYPVKDADDKIFSLNETINGINIRTAGYLGGYFLSIIDKDKIVSFKSI